MLRRTVTSTAARVDTPRNKAPVEGGPPRRASEDGEDEPVSDQIMGTPGNDTLVGTSGDDVIDGMGGADTIDAGDGNDRVIISTPGQILLGLDGGAGIDTLVMGTDDVIIRPSTLSFTPRFEFWEAPANAGWLILSDEALTNPSNGAWIDLRGMRPVSGVEGVRVRGTEGRNQIYGSDGSDILEGAGGDDFLFGDGGVDVLYGGDGNDSIHGEAGDDFLYGGAGDDSLFGGRFDSDNPAAFDTAVFSGLMAEYTITRSNGRTTVSGPDGTDSLAGIERLRFADGDILQPGVILGTSSADAITGTSAADQIFGLEGNDVIDGAGGNDVINAGDGDDRIIASTNGSLNVQGGFGFDTLVLGANAAVVGMSAGHGIEVIEALAGGSTLSVIPATAFVLDLTGVTVTGGPLTVSGAIAPRTYRLTESADTFISNMVDPFEIEEVYAGNGNDVINGQYGRYYGEGGNDIIRSLRRESLEGPVTLDGGAGDDTLYTSGAFVSGGEGADRVIAEGEFLGVVRGGAGFDTYVMRDGDVRQNFVNSGLFSGIELIEATANAGWIRLTPDTTNAAQGRGSSLDLSSVIGVVGGGRVSVSGTANPDNIRGTNAGDVGDVIAAGAGDDVVTGGRGNDQIDGGDGADTAVYTQTRLSDAYVFRVGDVTWVYTSGEGVDRLIGVETLRFESDGVVSTVSIDVAMAFPTFSYVASYDDLIAEFGVADAPGVLAHWLAEGQAAGRNPKLFDPLQYVASYNDLIAAYSNDVAEAARHYIRFGSAEGRSRDAFDALQYLAGYDDLALAFGSDEGRAAAHYIYFGHSEGRQRDNFDSYQYLASYADARAFAGTDQTKAALHFLEIGILEGLARDSFDELQYLASYGDLIEAYGENLAEVTRHYVHFGAAEGRAVDLFDAEQYIANYADLQAAYGDDLREATRHYIVFGYAEGRTDADLSAAGGGEDAGLFMALGDKGNDPHAEVLPAELDFGMLRLALDGGSPLPETDTAADIRAKGLVMPPEWGVIGA